MRENKEGGQERRNKGNLDKVNERQKMETIEEKWEI